MKRKKCVCGSERFLVKPAWYNRFKKPTWVCAAKSCKLRKHDTPELSYTNDDDGVHLLCSCGTNINLGFNMHPQDAVKEWKKHIVEYESNK